MRSNALQSQQNIRQGLTQRTIVAELYPVR